MNLHALNAIFAVTGRPGYVKTAGADAPAGYADTFGGKYPCQDRSATWTSAMEAHRDGAPAEIQSKIAACAKVWGIEADVAAGIAKLAASTAQLSEDQLPDADFTLCQEHNGAKIRKFAAVDAETTVDAAIAFHDNRAKYPLAWRKQASVNLLARAQEFDALLPEYVNEYLHKAAGFAVATQASVDQILIERANRSSYVGDEASAKLASILGELAENEDLRHNVDRVNEVVELLDSYDRSMKLAQFYNHGVSLPEELLAVTEPKLSKMAGQERNHVRLVNGHTVDIRHLDGDTLDTVSDGLAKLSHAKLADVLPTLPKPEADLLVQLMPKTAAVAGGGIPGPEMGTLPPHVVNNSPLPRPAGTPTSNAAEAYSGNRIRTGDAVVSPDGHLDMSPGNTWPIDHTPAPTITPDDPHGQPSSILVHPPVGQPILQQGGKTHEFAPGAQIESGELPKHANAAQAPVMGPSFGSKAPVSPHPPGPAKPTAAPVPGMASTVAHPVDGASKPAAGPIGVAKPPEHISAVDLLGK